MGVPGGRPAGSGMFGSGGRTRERAFVAELLCERSARARPAPSAEDLARSEPPCTHTATALATSTRRGRHWGRDRLARIRHRRRLIEQRSGQRGGGCVRARRFTKRRRLHVRRRHCRLHAGRYDRRRWVRHLRRPLRRRNPVRERLRRRQHGLRRRLQCDLRDRTRLHLPDSRTALPATAMRRRSSGSDIRA